MCTAYRIFNNNYIFKSGVENKKMAQPRGKVAVKSLKLR